MQSLEMISWAENVVGLRPWPPLGCRLKHYLGQEFLFIYLLRSDLIDETVTIFAVE